MDNSYFLFKLLYRTVVAFLITFLFTTSIAAQNSGAWTASGSGATTTWSANNGEAGVELVTVTASATDYGSGTGFTLNDFQTAGETLICNPAFTSIPSMVNNPSLSIRHTFPNSAFITFTFSSFVTNPVIHFDRLGGGGGPGGTTTASRLSVVTPGITLTELSGNDTHFVTDETNQTITRTSGMVYTESRSECDTPLLGTAAGSVRLNGTFSSVTFEISMNASGSPTVNDRFEIAFSDLIPDDDRDGVPNVSDICNGFDDTVDTDNDTVPDGCDLDDDNDGVLDINEGIICSPSFVALGQTFTNTSTGTNGGTAIANLTGLYPFNGVDVDASFELIGTATWSSGVASQTLSGVSGAYINTQINNSSFPEGDVAVYTYTFSKPVYNVEFKFGGLDNQDRIDVLATDGSSNAQVDITDINLGTNGTFFSQSVISSASANNAPNNAVQVSIEGPVTVIEIRAAKQNASSNLVTMQFYELEYCTALDTDNDTIPDLLDTDSDNDGCPDAVEANGSFMPSQLTVLAFGSNGAGSSLLNFGTAVDTTPGSVTLGVPIEDANGLDVSANTPQVITVAVTDASDTLACQADLSLTKTVDNAVPKIGSNIVYTLTVTNDGAAEATGVQVTDVLPTGLTFLSMSGGSYSEITDIWTIGSLNVNQTTTLQITATVSGAGFIINNAEITQSNQNDVDSQPETGN
ncbi:MULTISPECIES: DUF11 domain-containing protein [Tenacibaculum]|uniref:DUF11 domain-containing protein n=1 Tax=Tenacibaculum TaxID=104267 RepID=UPI001F0B4466|nr:MULTISPECIES: DUF11 domain-containing protein [Tenacibaculum]MCH3882631.1 DUF11 domain-containing protein [Tenacibaculum aquimarinum]MDO6600678.1 DUF11 domain-containing protein [Tenacibaculum sp. 1_MG-2023]